MYENREARNEKPPHKVMIVNRTNNNNRDITKVAGYGVTWNSYDL